PRGDRIVLLDDRAAVWREPLHAPCREPLDRDAAGADRDDAGRYLRVLPAPQGRLPRSAKLVGTGPPGADGMGSAPASRCRRALSQAVAARILAAQLLLGDRKRRARGRVGRRAAGWRRQYLRVDRLPAFRLK